MPRKLKDLSEIENEFAKSIGTRIAEARKKKGITQVQLAENIRITQKLVSSYEVGRITLSAEMLFRIAKVLNVTSDELLGRQPVEDIDTAPSLRLAKRMNELEQLPEPKKKAILKTLDDLLKANSE